MKIVTAEKKGAHLEFTAARGEDVFLFIFHTAENRWSVLKVRPDGEREVLTREEASKCLRDFPRHRALRILEDHDDPGGQ